MNLYQPLRDLVIGHSLEAVVSRLEEICSDEARGQREQEAKFESESVVAWHRRAAETWDNRRRIMAEASGKLRSKTP